MKVPLCLLVLLIFTSPVFSQPGNHEIGFNASPLIHQILRSASIPEDSDHSLLIEYGPYMVNYRHYGRRTNFRFGAGMLVNNNIEERLNFLEETKRIHIDVRVGLEKMYSISKNWKAFYGLDVVFSDRKVHINFFENEDVPKELKSAFGGGPVFGIQYFFLERFSLFTESSFYFLRFQKKNNTLTTINGNSFFIKSKTQGFQSVFNLPLSLFLNYRF